jgi:hypothetical protein
MIGEHAAEVCARIKKLGYARSKHIRMYGQEFVVVSDPFADGSGIAVEVISQSDVGVRTLRLPHTLLHGFRKEAVEEEVEELATAA